jgi:hypothetical protein
MLVEKLRDEQLVGPAYINPAMLHPSQEVGSVAKVPHQGVPGVTALGQVSIEGLGARVLRALFNTPRKGLKLACRIHRGLLQWNHDESSIPPKLCPVQIQPTARTRSETMLPASPTAHS